MKSLAQSEPLYGAVPLGTIALFVLNNFWLKSTLPGVVTGKLSDVCACFFVPLFVAAGLRELTSWTLRKRLHYGAAVMVLSLILVKGTEAGSHFLNSMIAQATAFSGLTFRPNVADPTDLFALPMVALSYLYALFVRERSFRNLASGHLTPSFDPSSPS